MPRLRVAFRSLARRPAVTVVAVCTLALGIGANAAIFSVIDAVLLRPLPYAGAGRLVMPWAYSPEVHQRLGFDRLPSSAADFLDFHARTTTLEVLASMRGERANITEGEPERVGAVRVSADFFRVLDVAPAAGRVFGPGDERQGRVVMLGHSLWTRRFGADPAVAGRTLSLNGAPATITGVLPEGFHFPAAGDLPEAFGFTATPEIWTLDVLRPDQRVNRGGKSLVLLGRLRPGVSIADAEAEFAAIAADIARESPATNAGWTMRVLPMREQLVGRVRPPLMVLLAAAAVVLLIACTNVGNLLLVAAAARRPELAIRAALGAGRRRLLGDLLIESILLGIAAGVAGLLVAWWTLRALLAAAPPNMSAVASAAIDARVLAFTLALSVLAAFIFGLVPAVHLTRGDTAGRLREEGRGSAGSRRASRLRAALVVVEVALAVVLLVAAALLLQAFARLSDVDTGFSADRVLTMEVVLPDAAYPGARAAAFFEAVIERLGARPGVEAAGATSGLPFAGADNIALVTIEGGAAPRPGSEIMADYRSVTNGYFAALRIPLVDGTWLPLRAEDDTHPVLISERLARAGWPDGQAIGRRLKLAAPGQDAPWRTVVGIVGDTRQGALDAVLRPQVYSHLRHAPGGQMALVVRTAGDPAALGPPARGAVAAVDPRQPVSRMRTMDEVIGASVSARRFQALLVGAFAALAVVLAVVGLYAVMASSVAERRHELGVRMALGARPSSVVTLVLAEGLRLSGLGIAVGIGGAFALTGFLEAQLYGIHARDAATFVAVPLVLLLAAIGGCLLPARRAMRVDPSTALRGE